MARIEELNISFEDGVTILNADIMNAFQDKINTLVRIHNEETPQMTIIATMADRTSNVTGINTPTGGRTAKSSYNLHSFNGEQLGIADRWKTISIKVYSLSTDNAPTLVCFYSRYNSYSDYDFISAVSVPEGETRPLIELNDIPIPEGTTYIRVQNKPAGLATDDVIVDIKGY